MRTNALPVTAQARASRGYTAVEVLLSLTLLSIGAAGVISMQKTALQGNQHARNLDIANNIARTWVERLRADMMNWTLPNIANPDANNWQNARYLRDTSGNATIDQGWFLPNQALPTFSAAFDSLGQDMPAVTPPNVVTYCTHVRIDCLNPTVAVGGNSCSLMRATVRVFWPRRLSVAPANNFCTASQATAVEANPNAYFFVYTTTALRQNTVQ